MYNSHICVKIDSYNTKNVTYLALNEEAEYKRAAPRAEVMFQMHESKMAARQTSRVALLASAVHTHMIDTASANQLAPART